MFASIVINTIDISYMKCYEFELIGRHVSEAEIVAFEKRHNVLLPDDYRNFLLTTNGGMIVPEVYESGSGYDVSVMKLYSLNDDYPYDLDHSCISTDWADAHDNGYLQIGHDSGGSGIILSTKGEDRGFVYYCDREEVMRPQMGLIKIADSFSNLLDTMKPLE